MPHSSDAQDSAFSSIKALALHSDWAITRALGRDALGHQGCVALDGHAHGLGQADAVGVDVDLDELGLLRPVVQAVARQVSTVSSTTAAA